MTLTALACGILAIVLFWWVFTAVPETDLGGERAARLQALSERKQAVEENLSDLTFEHQAGKLNDQDFDRTRQMLEREVARVAAKYDKLAQSK